MVQSKNTSVVGADAEACGEVEQRDEIRERFWRAVERVGERNADKDPDDVLRDVTEAVEEVRQEMYERERRAQSSR